MDQEPPVSDPAMSQNTSPPPDPAASPYQQLSLEVSKLDWNPAATQALSDLKTRFTSAPILHHPDPTLLFTVEVDASNTGIGAILSQRHS